MTLILSHIGELLPTYFLFFIKQTRKFYDGKIILVTNSTNTNELSDYNLEIYNPNFENKKFKICEKIDFYSYPNKNFWLYALVRFFFIEDYVVENKIENFVIYENDVLIYNDLSSVVNKISKIYENIAFTIGDDTRVTTGFSFFKSYEDLIRMNKDIIKIVQNPDDMNDIRNNYASCCPSEMVFIRKICKEKNYIKPLPLFPEDKYYDELGFVFDPAGYGLFLGGTSPENGDFGYGYIDKTTYIGKKLLNEEYIVNFSKEEGPTIIDKNNKTTKIYNLHIHSKKLYNFI